MRLLILSDSAAPHTRRWARWFALRAHEVHVVSFNPGGLLGYEPAIVHSVWQPRFGNALPERILKTPIILAWVRALFRKHAPDVVHAHSAGGYAWAAMLSGFRPYVVTPWGTDLLVDARRSRVNRWLTARALRRAALVTTDGFHFVDILREFGVPEERTLVHTFGVNVQHFAPGPDEIERAALGATDGPIIISTRTPNPVHDVETFIRALPAIHAKHPSACFVIVGDGTDRLRLEALANELGIAPTTIFTGRVEEDRMRRLLRAADIYVSTSKMDAGLAGSTAEAMATGLPVVHTDNSDNAKWVRNGDGGYLFGNGDSAALAKAVCRLVSDGRLRVAMGERNRRVVVERYNTDKEMQRIEEAYVRVAEGARRVR